MTTTYDLIVIGAGMAGDSAARKCAAAGWKVAIVDDLPYGGTCALRGCDPKKILRRAAEVVDGARLMRGRGIDDSGLSIDWADLMKHKRGFTDPVPGNMERGLRRAGVDTLHGTAKFSGPQQLVVDGTTYDSRHFLIATGARPMPLPIPGAEHLIDSTGFLNLEDLPARIVFVGAGLISFEFAHIAARAGSEVVILDVSERVLTTFDPDMVDRLLERSRGVGVDIRLGAAITAVDAAEGGYRVTIDQGGAQATIATDLLVHGAGRVPELSRLGLDAANVAHTRAGVTVAGHLQSVSNPAVYAAGDAADTPGMPLTPVAVFEGKVAASNMLKGKTTVPDYDGIPTVVFTVPELARVGLLESEAEDAGLDIRVKHTDTSRWFSNYRIGEQSAAVKILINKADDTIVGAHMFGPEYAEVINYFAMAIKLGLTTRQLKSVTMAYPTVSSDLGSML